MRSKNTRSVWKHLLATTVVAMTFAPACEAQQRGKLAEALLERMDTDGDGRLSAQEWSKVRNRNRRGPEVDTAVPDQLKSLYKAQSGPHQIGSISSLKLSPSHREDGLPIRITYPKSTGKFPVIVFAHGAYGSKDGYDPIVQHWAQHGYVVIQGTHPDSLSLLSAKEQLRVVTSLNPFRAMPIEKHWKTRAQDVAAILDSLSELAPMHAPLRGKMNLDQVGMGGHSFGGQTTQVIGGLNLGVDLKHDKPRALLLLSPPGPNALVRASAYAEMKRPVMTVTGSKDNMDLRNQTYKDRLKTHENIPSSDKLLLFMDDAEHNLGGVSGTVGRMSGGGANTTHLTCVKSATTAFWDHHLKSSREAKAFLKSGAINKQTDGKAELR